MKADERLAETAFARRLRDGATAVALEITPPQTHLPAVLRRRASLLGANAQAINVIDRPGRMSSLDASLVLLRQGFEPTWHLVARGRTAAGVASEIERAQAGGIRQVLCILGDQPGEDAAAAPTVRELVRMVSAGIPGALVGATFNQYVAGGGRAYANLFAKIEAGATFVQTQPVFDTRSFFAAASRIRGECPAVAVVPMVMPLLEREALERIQRRLGIAVPDGYAAAVAAGTGAAWEAFDRLLEELVGTPDVQALAVMTYEMDAPPGTGERLIEALRRCGAAQPGDEGEPTGYPEEY